MTQVFAVIILMTAIISGGIYTAIHPIYLPNNVVVAIYALAYKVWLWDGILPVEAIFSCFQVIIYVMFGKLIFKLFFGMISMFTGGHQPDID